MLAASKRKISHIWPTSSRPPPIRTPPLTLLMRIASVTSVGALEWRRGSTYGQHPAICLWRSMSPPPGFDQNRRAMRRFNATTRHQTWQAHSIGWVEGSYLILFLSDDGARRNSMKPLSNGYIFVKLEVAAHANHCLEACTGLILSYGVSI